MSDNTCSSRNSIYIEFDYVHFYIITILIVVCGAMLDWGSTYLMFRDFPSKAFETNDYMRMMISRYGPEGVWIGWSRMMLSYLSAAMMGSVLLYYWIGRFLDVEIEHQIWFSLGMSIQFMMTLVYGAGLFNMIQYFGLVLT